MSPRSGLKDFIRPVCAAALALGLPLAAALFFRAEGPIGLVFAVDAAAVGLFFLRSRTRGALRSAIGLVLCLGFALAALALVLYVIVIPFSFYLAWMEVVVALRPGGIISFLFFAVTAFFASLFAGLIFRHGPARPLAGAAVVALFEAAVIFRTPAAVVLFTLAVIAAVALLARVGRKRPFRRLALPGALLAVTIAAAALFSVEAAPNSGVLTRTSLITDIKQAIIRVFPDVSSLATVAGYGYFFDKNDLGQKPILSSVPLLRVENARRPAVYLRTQVYDEYFNNNWGISRYFMDRMSVSRQDILTGAPAGEDGMRVTVLFDFVPFLPHTLSTASLAAAGDPAPRIVSGNFETGFDLEKPLFKGDVLFTVPGPAPAPLPAEESALLGPDHETRPFADGGEREPVMNQYRQLPTSLTPRILDLARALKAADGRPWRTLVNIKDYLNGNFEYSLDTAPPPHGEEFLDDFLFVRRRGFCVHFATAFVVLARCNGIPARYVSGFLALPARETREAEVTGMNAHAWPEAWLEETGWISLEATPAFNPRNEGLPDFYRRYNPGADDLTARQLEALMGARVKFDREPPPGLLDLARRLLPAAPYALGVLGAAALGLGVWALARRMKGRRRRYRGRRRTVNRLLVRLVTRMERRSVPPPEVVGWAAWGESLAARFPKERRHVLSLSRTAQRLFFTRDAVSRRQVLYVKRVSRRLHPGKR